MPGIISARIRLGMSACVYACPVRYNGKAFDALGHLGREASDYVVTPVCPECLAGFGVPREPIHLTGPGAAVLPGEAQVRDRHGHDVTARAVAGARAALDALDRADVQAVVLKEASPSCGFAKARVGRKRTSETGAGVFGAMLLERGWFVIPDDAFASPLKWWDWRRRLHAWLWVKDRPLPDAAAVYDAWHVLKFVVQETDRPTADALGRELASMGKRPSKACIEGLRCRMMDALRKPSTPAKVRQALWKTYTFNRKHGRLDGVELHDLSPESPEVLRNTGSVVRDLTAMERVSFENDLLFGTTPVLARDERRVRARDERRAAEGASGAPAPRSAPAPKDDPGKRHARPGNNRKGR